MARPIVDGIFELDAAGHPTLLGGRSASSGWCHFPQGEVCPYTGADDVEPVRLSRTGTLWAWTAVTAAPAGYHGPVPYGFGVVELPEGLRVLGRLTEPDPARLTFGQPMTTVVERLPDGDGGEVAVWAFAPVGDR